MDPADVRKVILEQGFGTESELARGLRDRLFGQWEMNWIGYNCASDIELPGAGGRRPDFAFLVYPCAFTSAGQPNYLDPERFCYEIVSSEVVA